MKAMDEPNSILNVEALPGPLKAIRKKCLWCMNGSDHEVRLCTLGEECTLYPYRFGKTLDIKPEMSPLKAIKARCLECSGGDKAEQRKCDITDCVLWPYRLGHNPKRKGMGNFQNLSRKTSTQGRVEACRNF